MPEDDRSDGNRDPRLEGGSASRPILPVEPPVTLEDTQPSRPWQPPSPDDVETGELPGELGEPTIAMPRVPSGATPTASLPRTVPPPQRPGYVPPRSSFPPRGERTPVPPQGEERPRRRERSLIRAGFAVVVATVLIFFLVIGAAIAGYVVIASQLPSPEELQTSQTAFVSSKIYDRTGRHLLY